MLNGCGFLGRHVVNVFLGYFISHANHHKNDLIELKYMA